jgi:hypothetical protein
MIPPRCEFAIVPLPSIRYLLFEEDAGAKMTPVTSAAVIDDSKLGRKRPRGYGKT